MQAIASSPSVDNRLASHPGATAYRRNAEPASAPEAEPDNATSVTLSPRAQALARTTQAAPERDATATREQEQTQSDQMSQLNAQVRRAYLSE